MPVSVPDDVPPALSVIASLSEKAFEAAIAVLDQDSTTGSVTEAPDKETLELLAGTGRSLQLGQDTLGLSRESFISDVLDSLIASKKLNLGTLTREQFFSRLVRLLSASFIGIGAKATSLWLENERYAVGSRIVTDIRPIFGDEIEDDAPTAALIIHTLRLEYSEAGERKRFFLFLDGDDIESLLISCERALEKQRVLGKFLASTNVALLSPFSENDSDYGAAPISNITSQGE